MGYYGGTEIWEYVGYFLLSQLANIINKDSVGLYRDDELQVLRNILGPETDRRRKSIII